MVPYIIVVVVRHPQLLDEASQLLMDVPPLPLRVEIAAHLQDHHYQLFDQSKVPHSKVALGVLGSVVALFEVHYLVHVVLGVDRTSVHVANVLKNVALVEDLEAVQELEYRQQALYQMIDVRLSD